MNYFKSLFISLILLQAPLQIDSQCPAGFVSSQSDPTNCYNLLNTTLTQVAAVVACNGINSVATLPIFLNQQEYSSYLSLLNFVGIPINQTQWVGVNLTSVVQNVSAVLTGGSLNDFSNLLTSASQVQNSNSCFYINGQCSDSWSLTSCTASNNFLCQLRLNINPCPYGWVTADPQLRTCYKKLSATYTFNGAVSACYAINSYSQIPVFKSDAEYFSFLKSGLITHNSTAWIGYRRGYQNSSMFTEYDGNPLSVTPMWNQNQPDNVNESCVQLNGYGWDDDNCIKQRPVICQMRMSQSTICPTGFYYDALYPTICYATTTISTTWPEAELYCNSLTIFSAPTLPMFLTDNEYNSFVDIPIILSLPPTTYHWIGAIITAMGLTWVNGYPVSTSHWYSYIQQGYAYMDGCVYSRYSDQELWMGDYCTTSKYSVICQYRLSFDNAATLFNSTGINSMCPTTTTTKTSTTTTSTTTTSITYITSLVVSTTEPTTSQSTTVTTSAATTTFASIAITTPSSPEFTSEFTTTASTTVTTSSATSTPQSSTVATTTTTASTTPSSSQPTSTIEYSITATTTAAAVSTIKASHSHNFPEIPSTETEATTFKLSTKSVFLQALLGNRNEETSTAFLMHSTTTSDNFSESFAFTSTEVFSAQASSVQSESTTSLTETFFNTTDQTDLTSLSEILMSAGIYIDDLTDPGSISATIQTMAPMIIASLNDTIKRELGQELSDLVRTCNYDGKDCYNESNFGYKYDPTYGNCYVFNSLQEIQSQKFQVSNAGMHHGFKVLLGSSQADYSCTSMEAGLRLVFHQSNSPSYPESEGYSVTPGTVTYISLTQTTIQRSDSYWRSCAGDVFQDFVNNYTVEGCVRLCIQKRTKDSCNCINPYYPSIRNAKYCSLNQKTCMDYIVACSENFLSTCNCPVPCNEVTYKPTITSVKFLSKDYRDQYCSDDKNVSHCIATFDKNFALVYVYYDTLKSTDFQEIPAYDVESLLSDIAGNSGILLGVCVLSFVEVAYLMFGAVYEISASILMNTIFLKKENKYKRF